MAAVLSFWSTVISNINWMNRYKSPVDLIVSFDCCLFPKAPGILFFDWCCWLLLYLWFDLLNIYKSPVDLIVSLNFSLLLNKALYRLIFIGTYNSPQLTWLFSIFLSPYFYDVKAAFFMDETTSLGDRRANWRIIPCSIQVIDGGYLQHCNQSTQCSMGFYQKGVCHPPNQTRGWHSILWCPKARCASLSSISGRVFLLDMGSEWLCWESFKCRSEDC